ncbi:unnamed protein product, partial [marine sediment metagenome]
DLENYIIWTKVYVAFPDLVARFSKGWITSDEVLSELKALGMPPDRAEEMLQTKIVNPYRADRVAKERDLTKSEIIKGVKKDVISEGDGIDLLLDMGYDHDEADYIIKINVEAAGSPETLFEFKKLTNAYRRSQGLTFKEIPPEILTAEKTLLDLEHRRSEAISGKESQSVIDRLEVDRAEAAVKYRELLKLHGL